MADLEQAPARTPLYARHIALGGRMVDFAGYALPVNYSKGIIAEHLFTRDNAGLFDVSHMGQAFLSGPDASRRLESLVPGDIQALALARIRYTQFTNDEGGILDDLMVTKLDADATAKGCFWSSTPPANSRFRPLRAKLPDLRLEVLEDHALLALQGPAAAAVLERHLPGVSALGFMACRDFSWRGAGSVRLALRLYRRGRFRDFLVPAVRAAHSPSAAGGGRCPRHRPRRPQFLAA